MSRISAAASILPLLLAAIPNATTQSQGNHLCDFCHLSPKHNDGRRVHPFCSRTCAANAALVCTVCHVKPRFDDGQTVHPYCGKTCAANAKGASSPTRSRRPRPAAKPPAPACAIPGCTKSVYSNNKGTSKYCSLTHTKLASEACLLCHKAPKARGNFCTRTCADKAMRTAPGLLEVPEGHVTFKSVEDQFKTTWLHTGAPCPTVRHVYKVLTTQASASAYEAYRAAVEARGNFVRAGLSAGNENRRWHGTVRECKIGEPGQTTPCASAACWLCSIIRTSHDVGKSRAGRFGAGVYTSAKSSNSNNYSRNVNASPLKGILLNKIVVGKICKLSQDNHTLTAPPAGYDSVLGNLVGGVNMDELVVYSNDAIRPSFLVMYDA